MKRVLMVCHGNICRSPMAEFVFKDLVQKEGLSDQFHIESAATSTEEIGNDIYPPAKKCLAKHHIPYTRHYARQITYDDYSNFDYLIGMDDANIRNMKRIFNNDPDHKVYQLLDFTDQKGPISDPWYTGDFEITYKDVLNGSIGLLNYIKNHQ